MAVFRVRGRGEDVEQDGLCGEIRGGLIDMGRIPSDCVAANARVLDLAHYSKRSELYRSMAVRRRLHVVYTSILPCSDGAIFHAASSRTCA